MKYRVIFRKRFGREGNEADDLTHPTQDATSPDDTNPVLRAIHNDCAVVPVEVAGVIGVTANGNLGLKSYYSSYGMGTAQVVAPPRAPAPAPRERPGAAAAAALNRAMRTIVDTRGGSPPLRSRRAIRSGMPRDRRPA